MYVLRLILLKMLSVIIMPINVCIIKCRELTNIMWSLMTGELKTVHNFRYKSAHVF